MKQVTFELVSQCRIATDVYKMELHGDISAITAPGQFVNVALPQFSLRRPISVCDVEPDDGAVAAEDGSLMGTLTLIYKVVGQGTKVMSALPLGTVLDVLTGLGNGYDLSTAGERPLLVGGGVGTPPLYLLARRLRDAGKEVSVILGFNTAAEVFYREEFEDLGCRVYVATMDGSLGTKGFVTTVLAKLEEQAARVNGVVDARQADEATSDAAVEIPADINSILPDSAQDLRAYTYFYSCGPKPMLKALCDAATGDGQVSMEERMGCGFGACMGCSLQTKKGSKRVCKEGPVFDKEDLLW